MIGFTLGGPIGGIIGAIIGSKLSDNQPRPSINQQNQAAFFTALFACFAKIAKADGIVTREEVDKVDLDLVWDPPWDKSMMSEAAKLELNL